VYETIETIRKASIFDNQPKGVIENLMQTILYKDNELVSLRIFIAQRHEWKIVNQLKETYL
jgi:hypothetical protein